MTAPYKKRALAGWNHDKQSSNKAERAADGIELDLQVNDQSKLGAAVNKKKADKLNKKVRRDILDLKWALKSSQGKGLESLNNKEACDSFFANHYSQLCRDAKAAIPRLKAELESETLPSKIKKQIRELLDQLPQD